MSHNAPLEAHEHSEHAEHAAHASDPFISRVAITVAALAVLAAGAGSLETVEGGKALNATSEAVLMQDRATDSWNEYQATKTKLHISEVGRNQLALVVQTPANKAQIERKPCMNSKPPI